MKRTALIIILAVACNAYGQDKILPAEARPFVPRGYEMLDYMTGDLNGDKRPDAIMILRQPGEDTLYDDGQVRPLILMLRQPNGRLKQEKRNDKMVLCRHCGGAFGDPYAAGKIEGNGFNLNFYGGSNWRWVYDYTFSYNPATRNWMLTKETQESFNSGDPDMTIKETNIGAAELAGINFDNFNASPAYDDSRWKVSAAKTFFYDSPGLGNKPRKGYLVMGNVATGIRELKNFVEISFANTKEEFTTGYILKKDLVKIKK